MRKGWKSSNVAAAELDPGALRLTSSAKAQCFDMRGGVRGAAFCPAAPGFFPIFFTKNIEKKNAANLADVLRCVLSADT